MTPPKRHQTATERDLAGIAARKERDAAAPDFVAEECTDRLEGDELHEARVDRAKRDPAGRIAKLEAEQHETRKAIGQTRDDVANLRVSVAEIRGDQKAANTSLSAIEKSLERVAQREHITFTAKVDVDKAQQLDAIDARKVRRQLVLKVVGVVLGGWLALDKFLHWLGVF